MKGGDHYESPDAEHPAEDTETAWRPSTSPLILSVLLPLLRVQVVGGKMTETGRLGAFITKVKKGSLADVVGHLRAGVNTVEHIVPTQQLLQLCAIHLFGGQYLMDMV